MCVDAKDEGAEILDVKEAIQSALGPINGGILWCNFLRVMSPAGYHGFIPLVRRAFTFYAWDLICRHLYSRFTLVLGHQSSSWSHIPPTG